MRTARAAEDGWLSFACGATLPLCAPLAASANDRDSVLESSCAFLARSQPRCKTATAKLCRCSPPLR
ncbi:hypothetical protein TB9_04225 [Xanthomonas perforans]|uniref:Secreted protein n=1 Tax=Xanthomonas perforans TaxID=442694 RepID=A0ABR5EQ79_XANPE|nr:hypothetical protein XP315_14505 [Xanthomonas perforans]OCG95628.1 hypothetical protein LMG918_13100 [Xanthomonas euvesicatoria]TKA17821.1 hypothetical protein TN51_08325 [Xanthomonas euvesicatoria pv. citrumelonis]KLC09765.1 hypothetical protein XP420_05200 [Xanthomonas perforans]KLC11388.1 hypothetical protein XP4B_12045 [Xanthomonas perforans]